MSKEEEALEEEEALGEDLGLGLGVEEVIKEEAGLD